MAESVGKVDGEIRVRADADKNRQIPESLSQLTNGRLIAWESTFCQGIMKIVFHQIDSFEGGQVRSA